MGDRINNLEQRKLEYTLNGLGVESYTWLLAYYFLQGDKCKAKYLWKRVPKQVKQRNPEFEAVWTVGNRLWQKDTPGFYQAVGAYQWTALTSSIIVKLTERVREQTIHRIGADYTSIPIQDLAALLGLSVAEVESEIIPKTGWMLQDDGIVKISEGDDKDPYPSQLTTEGHANIKKIIELLHVLIILIMILLISIIFF